MVIPKTHFKDKKDNKDNREQVDCLIFADDIAIISETEKDSKKQLDK